jgi:hypothetical protein
VFFEAITGFPHLNFPAHANQGRGVADFWKPQKPERQTYDFRRFIALRRNSVEMRTEEVDSGFRDEKNDKSGTWCDRRPSQVAHTTMFKPFFNLPG